MEQYADVVLDLAGNAVEGATVQVLAGSGNAQSGYTTSAQIFDVNGAALANSTVTTGTLGEFAFLAPNGKYVLRVTVRGTVYRTIGPLTFYDPEDDTRFNDVDPGLRDEVDALVQTVNAARARLADLVSVKDAPFNAKGDGIADDTAAINAALAAALDVTFPDGTYRITNELTLRSKQTVTMTAGVTVRQYGANKTIFRATQCDNVWLHCNGAVLYGEGTWSNSWTGNGGHEDRGIQFIGCTRSGVSHPVIKNCGSAGIAIIGGRGITVAFAVIEGTHLYSTPLPSTANFQNAIYIADNATYGTADEIKIIAPDISGAAMGVLRENYGTATLSDVTLNISSPNIHDIPGQHAFYIQGGLVTVSNPTLSNIELGGFKVQSADAGQDIKGFTCTGASAFNVKSNLFEIATIGSGSISGVNLSAVGNACGTGISVNGKVKNLNANLVLVDTTAYAAYLFGADTQDVDLTINAATVGQDGVLITSTNSSGIRIRPTLRNCNNGSYAGGLSGVRVASASANVELFHPDITDSNGRSAYSVFNSVAGSDIKIRGSARLTGSNDTAIRATGTISEFPLDAVLQATNGAFTTMGNVHSSGPLVVGATSTGASNIVLWQQGIGDESAYMVRAEITGKSADAAERRAAVITGLFYRDAGGVATLQGAAHTDMSIASAGFAGNFQLQSNGAADIVLLVNSGGASTYLWTARVTVTKV